MLPSTFYLPGWGKALQVGFNLFGIAAYGQLWIWVLKEELAALWCVHGNVYFWPRIYQRSKAIMAVKELLELLCSVMKRCSLQWWWIQLLRPVRIAKRGKVSQYHFFTFLIALTNLQTTKIRHLLVTFLQVHTHTHIRHYVKQGTRSLQIFLVLKIFSVESKPYSSEPLTEPG